MEKTLALIRKKRRILLDHYITMKSPALAEVVLLFVDTLSEIEKQLKEEEIEKVYIPESSLQEMAK